jgi:hypothetical protein
MARTNLSVHSIDLDGLDFEANKIAASADGVAILNDGKTFVLVQNADAAGITITLKSNRVIHGLTLPDKTLAVGAGELQIVPLGPPDTFNQTTATETGGSDKGKAYVDFSAVTNVSVLAFRKD